MRIRKASVWMSLSLAALVALAPALAEARAGGGRSLGSRGARTTEAPAPTQTAPGQVRPMERSTAAQPGARPAAGAPARQGGFFQRNPFLGGLMGGLLGAGLLGLLMGGGFFGAGLSGMLGMLLQLALFGGLIYLALSFFRRRREALAGGPAYAPAPAPGQAEPMARMGALGGGAAPRRAARDEIGIGEADFVTFEQLLGEVQMAWTRGDVDRLRQLMTPEMAGYFADELAANKARGIVNHVEDGKLEQGDLAEAWREDGQDFATVAMRFSLLDYGKRISDGQVVEGSDKVRTEVTEIWTLTRPRGGEWILSAIQQTD